MALCKRLGFIAGLMLTGIAGSAVAAPPTEQQVRQLMEVIGLSRSLSQMNAQVATSMQQTLPCVSSNYWNDFINPDSRREYIGRLVPIYQKHFTAEEIDGMVKFYSSPLGQKVLVEMPLAVAEANQAGQQWTHEHGQQMIAKLQQAGTLSADGRCPRSSVASMPDSSATAESDDEEQAAPADESASAHTTADKKHGSSKKHAPAKKATSSKKIKTSPHKAAPSKKAAPAKKAPAKAPTKKKPKGGISANS